MSLRSILKGAFRPSLRAFKELGISIIIQVASELIAHKRNSNNTEVEREPKGS